MASSAKSGLAVSICLAKQADLEAVIVQWYRPPPGAGGRWFNLGSRGLGFGFGEVFVFAWDENPTLGNPKPQKLNNKVGGLILTNIDIVHLKDHMTLKRNLHTMTSYII